VLLDNHTAGHPSGRAPPELPQRPYGQSTLTAFCKRAPSTRTAEDVDWFRETDCLARHTGFEPSVSVAMRWSAYAVTDRKIVVVPAEAEGRSATRIRAVVYSSAVCVRQGGLLERVAQYFKSGLPYGVWTGTLVSLGPQRGRRGL
jgi:hypothetical protein